MFFVGLNLRIKLAKFDKHRSATRILTGAVYIKQHCIYVGRHAKLQSNFTKVSVPRPEKFMMYDYVFSTIWSSTKVKIQYFVWFVEGNKLPGADNYDRCRIFTRKNGMENQIY